MDREKKKALRIVSEVLKDNPAATVPEIVETLSANGIVREERTVYRYKAEVMEEGPFPPVSMEVLATETLAFLRASRDRAFKKQQYQQVASLSRVIAWLTRLDATFANATDGGTDRSQLDLLSQMLADYQSGQLEQETTDA